MRIEVTKEHADRARELVDAPRRRQFVSCICPNSLAIRDAIGLPEPSEDYDMTLMTGVSIVNYNNQEIDLPSEGCGVVEWFDRDRYNPDVAEPNWPVVYELPL